MLLFSDLHLSPRTFDTCMQVLELVHREALARNVSVGFLGDFFDHVYNKGTLPVDILNRLLRFFETKWKVPMIMIPGNHDYFDASETEHGLTPFRYASKYITVLDQPTVIDRQLWVPWRRSNNTLRQVIESHRDVDVIFGHFDIIGFKLTATRVSTEGLSASMFSPNIPVYSGHYHTPQTHDNIRYLGSPYQLTLSEAEDTKALVLLDTQTWRVSETAPLDVGQRQYKWTANELLSRKDELRPDDRVMVVVSAGDDIDVTIGDLVSRGIHVQTKKISQPITTRITQSTGTPKELLEAYAKRQSIDTDSDAWRCVNKCVSEESKHRETPLIKDVRPMRIEIEGFGPFPGPVTLPLEGRGFSLVSGELSGTKDASNGAGKSLATAGAWLWACTGIVDQRGGIVFSEGNNLIHVSSERAMVRVSGMVGSATWKIERSLRLVHKKRKHSLMLFVNGENRTRSTILATQRAIVSEIFGIEQSAVGLQAWLLRNSVWCQSSVTRWLDATESQAKQQIHHLANMHVWTHTHTHAKIQVKNLSEMTSALTLQLDHKKNILLSTKTRLAHVAERAIAWIREHNKRIEQADIDLSKTEKSLERAYIACGSEIVEDPSCEETMKEVETKMQAFRQKLMRLELDMSDIQEQVPEEWFRKDLKQEEMATRAMIVPNTEETSLRQDQCFSEVHARKAMLRERKKEFDAFELAGKCPTCKRPFDNSDKHYQHREALQADLKNAEKQLVDARALHVDAQQKHMHATSKSQQIGEHLTYISKVLKYRAVKQNHTFLSTQIDQLSEDVDAMRHAVQEQKAQVRAYQRSKQICEDLARSLGIMRRNREAVLNESCPYRVDTSEMDALEETIRNLESRIESTSTEKHHWNNACQWLGPRGVQTYAMERTIQTLASKTTSWLQRLFHTQDISMYASFDENERLYRHIETGKHAGVMSGGQWRRAQLASFMAWREMSPFDFPLLIMDEACTSMDAVGIRAVQEALREWCDEDERRTCYFITHEPEQHRDTSIYHNHTRILHKRGRSSIVQESSNKRRK